MNLLDAAFVVLIVVAAVAGFRSGAVPQLGGLIGAVLGGTSAILALPYLLGFLQTLDPPARAFVVLVGLLMAIGIGEAIGSTLGVYAARGLGGGVLEAIDRIGGALVGLAQGILVVWLAGGLLATGAIASLSKYAQTSAIVRGVDAFLPPPTDVAADLSRVLDATGLPDVFVGLEPQPAPPVQLPSDPEARQIAQLATGSTVKITSEACNFLLTGTGVVVADEYVATNAHVVAGSQVSRVALGGTVLDGTVVLFDPELDVALLHVPQLRAPALRFAASEPPRGTTGAALGFPGGGQLTVVPAAVTRDLTATGLDIYDEQRVTRNVLELQAQIQRGDSGGPLVLPDGTIGGLVFAEAKSDDQVGYALSPISVSSRIQPAIGRTGAVSTSDCVR